MFYELSASSHIQIPCHLFTGGLPKTDDDDENKNDDNTKEASLGNLVEEVMSHLLVEYCNKIIPPNHGLCITVSQIDNIGDARIFPEDGGTYVDVDFRLLIFKPYNSQVIEGEIATSDESGIRISLGFFEQVFIPKHNLPQPSTFDKLTRTWCYSSKNEELQFEKDDTVYLRVTKTDFKGDDSSNGIISPTPTPFPPKNPPTSAHESKDNDEEEDEDEDSDMEDVNRSKTELLENKLLKQPMIVYGSFDGISLGPCHWWE